MLDFDVIIIGAGAAGMFAAVECGRRGRRVLIVDHAKRAGDKIRISGGGRCNFTNLHCGVGNFLGENPRFAISALKRYGPQDFIRRVESEGIAYHEKTLGQLFCDGKATQIIDMFQRDMAAAGVELRLGVEVQNIRKTDAFEVTLSTGTVRAQSLIIATGGKSIPKMGATGFGYRIAEQFGLAQTATRPALVPLTFAEQDLAPIKALAGIAVDAEIAHGKTRFQEGLLFTHRGLSGPSILQISSYWREGDRLRVNLHTPENLFEALRDQRQQSGKLSVANALALHVPKRLAQWLAGGIPGNLADQSDKALRALTARIHDWQIKPVGSEGYRTAEVTLGGVDTSALNPKTMEARAVPGLYFIGEVVDITGWLGGYNFQWAWSSGFAAGQAA